jgi:hypothetical protein
MKMKNLFNNNFTHQTMNKITVHYLLPIFAAILGTSTLSAAEPANATPPDFTAGGQKDESHDWLLGPTGLRGWVFFRNVDKTASSRQILVTDVDKGSPADGIVKANDVILGVFGKLFADDARRSFGEAIATAEEKTGILPLTIWRDGKTSNVDLKLTVLGAYSAKAPYDCPKSKAIFEQGIRLIAEKGFANADIPDHFNALALLASGDAKYHPVLAEYAKKAAAAVENKNVWNWYIAWANLFLAEYTLATGDKSALPYLKATSQHAVKNQCLNGMWGHAPPLADRRSEGYGSMNVIGLPMTISLKLARDAGVRFPELDPSIDISTTFFRYYVDKGAIPYGDHVAWGNSHDDNGKSSCAAVLFDMLGEKYPTSFNSWMATAAYDHREQGHCGNVWGMLWALPGASRSGPLATGAYLKEQAWYYDLARNWKGAFVYQQINEDENGNYTNWDLTGAYLLSYGLYQKSIYITGKKPSAAPALDAEAVKKVIVAGRDRFPSPEGTGYLKRRDEELLEGLKSWSPAMRFHSAVAMGKRGGNFAPTLIVMLDGKDRYARYGAVEALGRLGKDATSALPKLRAALKDLDVWVQSLAAEALARINDRESIDDVFAMSLRSTPSDPRRMHQRSTGPALLSTNLGDASQRGLLMDSLDGVDRENMLLVMKSFLQNDDAYIRCLIAPILEKLSGRELALILPDLVKAIKIPAPSNEMYADVIRQTGLDLLARHHIREGMDLSVSTIEWRWGVDYRKRLEYLARYGKHAKELIPELQKKRPTNYPEGNADFDKAIAAIEASTEEPKLISLKDFIANAKKSRTDTNTPKQ